MLTQPSPDISARTGADPAPATLLLSDEASWSTAENAGVKAWFRGYLAGNGDRRAGAEAAAACSAGGPDAAADWLRAQGGHHAVIATGPGWTLAAVDHVRSIPLFYALGPEGWVVSDHAPSLVTRLGLEPRSIDRDAVRLFATSGFLFGADTLYRQVFALQAGECVVFEADKPPRTTRYYVYRPSPRPRDARRLRGELRDLTLAGLERLARSCAGREIVVPLSAGLDSRLIVAGLKHIGARNVRCFAYGRPGNFEAAASRRIAEKLGLAWTFVATTAETQGRLFASSLCRDYLDAADSLTALPFVQDIAPLREIRRTGFAPADAVLVNGQSGDYLTGNHIPASLGEPAADPGSAEERRARLTDAVIAKHHGLWQSLLTPAMREMLHTRIRADLDQAGADLGEPRHDFALYELSEWQNRQAKYVVAGQRAYEFFGHDWRLPLWEPALMDFWARAPLEAKYRQRLYREMLEAENWGGVWGPDWRFPYRVRPAGLATVRALCKALAAPLGRSRWRAFERRFLAWHQDVVANYAIAPWSRVVLDRRGHRNAISWHVEAYLAGKGFALDGAPPGEAA